MVLAASALAVAAPPAAATFRLTVPLDRSGTVPGSMTLTVHGDSEPRSSEPITLVLPESAGAPARDSYDWEDLLPKEQILTFDPRGTGRRALRCRDLEAADPAHAGRQAEACATFLGERRGFFRAADTVEDIEALRARIGVERMAIVGPGYGAYVAQRYALRYPEHVRRLILTAPVDAAGPDPLFRDTPAAVRRVLGELCRGRLCNRFTRDPVGDTRRLVSALAAGPMHGRVVDRFGHWRDAALTREGLFLLFIAGDANPFTRAEYPAAVVSALRGDRAPILRLARRARSAGRGLRPGIWSAAAAAAATCEETRFPWDSHATPAEREAAAQQTEAAMDPALADPFDPATLAGGPLMRLCSHWPTVSAGPPADPVQMPDVPALVLADPAHTGAPVEAAMRTAARFPRGKLLVTTVPPLDECAQRAVIRFMDDRSVQDRCPRSGPLLPPSAPMPMSLHEIPPLKGVPGRRGRLLNAVGATFGDLIDDFFGRLYATPTAGVSGGGLRAGGLRGGSYMTGGHVERLLRYEFVPGVRVSGRAHNDGAFQTLFVDGPGALNGRLVARSADDDLVLLMRGRIAGRRVRARVRIPSHLTELLSLIEGVASGRAAALPLLP
jgi:pimeloyl-ACP methyl ester carboxylesterase